MKKSQDEGKKRAAMYRNIKGLNEVFREWNLLTCVI